MGVNLDQPQRWKEDIAALDICTWISRLWGSGGDRLGLGASDRRFGRVRVI